MKVNKIFANSSARFGIVFALAFAGIIFAPATRAQLPGVPKLPGSGNKNTRDTKPSAKDTPTIKQVSPSKILPGKPFDLTITGTNLTEGMDIALACHDQMNGHDAAAFTVKPVSVKATSSATLVAHVEFPAGHTDSHCRLTAVGPDIMPGTQVVVSEHINDPMQLSGRFIGEGELEPMQMAQQIGPAMQRTGEKFELLPGSVRYTQGGKTLFDRPISDIKSIEPVKINGSSSGMFRLVFKDGKTYNFMPVGTGEDAMKQIDAAMQGR
jgi:hypothetical protein